MDAIFLLQCCARARRAFTRRFASEAHSSSIGAHLVLVQMVQKRREPTPKADVARTERPLPNLSTPFRAETLQPVSGDGMGLDWAF